MPKLGKTIKKIKASVTNQAKMMVAEAAIANNKPDPSSNPYVANWAKYSNPHNATPFQQLFYINRIKMPKIIAAIKGLRELVQKKMAAEAEIAKAKIKVDEIKRGSQLLSFELYYSSRKSPELIKAQDTVNTFSLLRSSLDRKILEQNEDIVDLRQDVVNDFMRAASASPSTRLDFLYQYYNEQTAEILNLLRLRKIPADDYLVVQETIRLTRASFPDINQPVNQSLPLIIERLQALKHLSPIRALSFDSVIHRLTDNLDVLGKQLKKEVDYGYKSVTAIQKHFRVKYTSERDNLYTIFRLSMNNVDHMIGALKDYSHYLSGADFAKNQRQIEDWQLFRYQLEHALFKAADAKYFSGFVKELFRGQLNQLTETVSPHNAKDKQLMKSMLTDLIAASKKQATVDTKERFVVPRADSEVLISLHHMRMHLINAKEFEKSIDDHFKQLNIGAKSPLNKDMLLMASTLTSLMTHSVTRGHALHHELTQKLDEVAAIDGNPKTAKQVSLEAEIARLRTDLRKNATNISDYDQMVSLLKKALNSARLDLVKAPNRLEMSAEVKQAFIKQAMQNAIKEGKATLKTDNRVTIGLLAQVDLMVRNNQQPIKNHSPTLYGKRMMPHQPHTTVIRHRK